MVCHVYFFFLNGACFKKLHPSVNHKPTAWEPQWHDAAEMFKMKTDRIAVSNATEEFVKLKKCGLAVREKGLVGLKAARREKWHFVVEKEK